MPVFIAQVQLSTTLTTFLQVLIGTSPPSYNPWHAYRPTHWCSSAYGLVCTTSILDKLCKRQTHTNGRKQCPHVTRATTTKWFAILYRLYMVYSTCTSTASQWQPLPMSNWRAYPIVKYCHPEWVCPEVSKLCLVRYAFTKMEYHILFRSSVHPWH